MKKPSVKLTGEDGNVFNLLGICTKALKRAGSDDKSKELRSRVFAAKSYDEALAIMGEYCELS